MPITQLQHLYLNAHSYGLYKMYYISFIILKYFKTEKTFQISPKSLIIITIIWSVLFKAFDVFLQITKSFCGKLCKFCYTLGSNYEISYSSYSLLKDIVEKLVSNFKDIKSEMYFFLAKHTILPRCACSIYLHLTYKLYSMLFMTE